MNLAPIVLFVYNRPNHTKQTVEALQKNKLAKESELFIYSDYAKNDEALEQMQEVRDYIKTIDGFKKITITQRDKNWGLANSIIDGVTKIVNQYGKIIVLEDDIVTSAYFLKFMNEALEFYKNQDKVWHISGWNYPIEMNGLNDVFLWRVMNCWGWATWANKWRYYDKNTNKLINEFSKEDIKKFNLEGVDNLWGQVLQNKEQKINTWAIFWYATIFKQNGLCLNPSWSFVKNIGNDNSGQHCEDINIFDSVSLNNNSNINFDIDVKENTIAINKIKHFFKSEQKPIIGRIVNKFLRRTTK